MPSIHDQLSEQFYRWEKRGRGWQVFDEPVTLEPPFVPFAFRNPFPDTPPVDTGRRPGFLGSLVRGLGKKLATESPPQSEPEQEDEETAPTSLIRSGLVELRASLPTDLDIPKEAFELFLSNLSLCREPIAFELVGTHKSVAVQFAASEKDAPALGRNLASYFPEAAFRPQGNMLVETWQTCLGEEELVVEFGLAQQFMFQLVSGKLDPFVGIVGALSQLQPDELGLFQVLWQLAREDWPESIMRSVTNGEGKPLFVDAPELTDAAEKKVSKSLYAAVVRIAVKAGTFERAVEIARDMASSLRVFANPHGNELIPLKNDDYPFESHVEDALARQSHRPGMILNSDELIGFVHLPGKAVRSSALERQTGATKSAPALSQNRLDFGDIMDSGKILLAKLPGGIIGRENSYLLGALLIAKFQQLVMARQAKQIAARRDFWIYIDEFANFITPSMSEILSGARKYRIGLTLAHHELHQLQKDSEVASAVMAHPYTRIVFRVSDDDTKRLAEGFSSFEASDLKNLETGQAICRLQRSNFDFNLSVPLPDLPDQAEMNERRQAAIAASRMTYGTPRAKVEAILQETWEIEAKPVEAKQPPKEMPPLPPPIQTSVPPPPKISEPPKAPEIVERKIVEPPRDLGRGGEQHKAIQQRIKKAAEGFGFRSTIEKPVLDGLGSIDLFLERDGQNIACEISLTTTIDHEVGNVSKCLKADVPVVVVICLDDERLRKIEKAVMGSLGADMTAQVKYFQPDPFIAHLKQLKPPEPQPSETSYGGYKVKRSVPKLSTQERRQKEDLANRVIAEALRRK